MSFSTNFHQSKNSGRMVEFFLSHTTLYPVAGAEYPAAHDRVSLLDDPVLPSSLDSIEPTLSRRRHLAGHIAPPLPQPEPEESRRASSRQAQYGKTDLESALSSTSLIQVP